VIRALLPGSDVSETLIRGVRMRRFQNLRTCRKSKSLKALLLLVVLRKSKSLKALLLLVVLRKSKSLKALLLLVVLTDHSYATTLNIPPVD
jgi:hypothetical protein